MTKYKISALKKYVTRDGEEKTCWLTVGTFLGNDDAIGIAGSTIELNMHPDLKLKVYPIEERGENRAAPAASKSTKKPKPVPAANPPQDDDIPF